MLLDVISNFLSLLQQVLEDELSACVLQNGIGDLGDGLSKVLDSIVGESRVDDSVIDGCIDVNRDVIFGDNVLFKGTTTCRAKSRTWILVLIIPRV